MSPTGDDTPQQGGSLDGSQPDPQPFNPKEISVDKSVPWQKSGPDNDGLSDKWEDNHNIDLNVDGNLSGGGDEVHMDKHGRVKVQFHWDQEGKQGGDAPGHELAHTVQQGMGDEGGVNDMTHKRPNRPVPIILALIAILLLLLGVGLITIFGDNPNTAGTNDITATTSSGGQIPTDEPTGAATHDTNQSSTTGGGGDQPTAVVTEPPPVVVATEPPAECAAGWLPVSGCTCCGTTLTCADGTVAEFNPQCGVGGSGGGGCQCICPVGNPNCIDTCTGAICTP